MKQKVGQHPHINVTDNDDMEQWDAVIMGNDELLRNICQGNRLKCQNWNRKKTGDSKTERYFPFITEALKTIWDSAAYRSNCQ